jgi:hypothetical protein
LTLSYWYPGILHGGQWINRRFIEWLKKTEPGLKDYPDWDEISEKFEIVKKSFLQWARSVD